MVNPKKIDVVRDKSTYNVPVFKVTDGGVDEAAIVPIHFCKGNKQDPNVRRQVGFFTETLIAVSLQYLKDNNVGDLENEYTSRAIQHLNSALTELENRAKDRADRGVQGTYQK